MAIGFSIAAPVGPIGVLCIRRSLADGWRVGLATGLGAATADAAYGCVAAFGLTAISSFLVNQKVWLGLIGGIFLCYLGIRTFLSKPAHDEVQTALRRWGASGFLEYIALNFPAHRFFACSSLGDAAQEREDLPQPLPTPLLVERPVLWLLHRQGIL